MKLCLFIACVLLIIAVTYTTVKIWLMHKSADEISAKIKESLKSDTNTLIDISSGDRHMRMLAAELNTQLKQLRKEQLQYQDGDAELKNAVTGISHDLRTPLTAINGYLDLLRNEEKSETAEKYLERIAERTESMKVLTEELFRYSVLNAQKEMEWEPICLNEALEEITASFYGAIVQRGIEPVIKITEIPIKCNLDKAALIRILENIMQNVIKYSDGDLEIELTDDGMIVISNTAKSLDNVVSARLFDRFYTVKNARRSTGLGLSIAKMLTEQMGGSISSEYHDEKLSIILKFTNQAN